MLSVQDVSAGYGVSPVLFDVSIGVNPGEVVTLLGRNGMGKTTTILSIMGILPLRSGEIFFEGTRVTGWPSFRVARLGLGTRRFQVFEPCIGLFDLQQLFRELYVRHRRSLPCRGSVRS